ncbi:helix-turn-helix domain-containing protein [Pseudomonas sp. CCC3.1]|uniref:response regulator transcription factor n=1 Tax=Pseudomonas sp. CCC3.1 TaxID=3048607 RepID=UPI002AC96866|nr:helix-turn-helix domain-containing protein [Pseudomonas sp. CCC3.1]MEB0206218.1 helix-turn-helix domain-containing protein [Pseudomonas sp. CCC3.1]WPX34962.1 helix-turn-helix domain-containing protein [Pseudomonas sp. CCC3.1]
MKKIPLCEAPLSAPKPYSSPHFVPTLTPKEQEILEWCAQGKTSAEVAIILKRSEATINFHIANLRLKFGVTSRHAAVLKAIKLGMPL